MTLIASSCSNLASPKWTDGPYKVDSLDVGLRLDHELPNGDSIGRVAEDVVAVGRDDTYIVAKQEDPEKNNLEQYFYIVRADDNRFLNAEEIVQGPFTKSEFDKRSKQLDLPEFSEEF